MKTISRTQGIYREGDYEIRRRGPSTRNTTPKRRGWYMLDWGKFPALYPTLKAARARALYCMSFRESAEQKPQEAPKLPVSAPIRPNLLTQKPPRFVVRAVHHGLGRTLRLSKVLEWRGSDGPYWESASRKLLRECSFISRLAAEEALSAAPTFGRNAEVDEVRI